MVPAHGVSGPGSDRVLADLALQAAPLVAVAGVWVGYLWLAGRARTRQGWPVVRTAWFSLGVMLLLVALSPALEDYAAADFGGHAAQHLLLAMLAPLALVLGRPVTLLLRALPHRAAHALGRTLNSSFAQVLSSVPVALGLSSGGLVGLYFTPLYRLSTQHEPVHLLVHVHLVASGFLFAWVIAGVDPAPHRPRVRTRLVTLGVSIAVHASVSQLLHAGLLVQVHEPVHQMRAAGSLMYFGGDIAELLLALALLVTARSDLSERRRRPSRGRRSGSGAPPALAEGERGGH